MLLGGMGSRRLRRDSRVGQEGSCCSRKFRKVAHKQIVLGLVSTDGGGLMWWSHGQLVGPINGVGKLVGGLRGRRGSVI